jgi:hypothetical protein
MASANRYAEVPTNADVATLRHLAETGMEMNTLRTLASNLAYLEAWCRVAVGRPSPGLPIPNLFGSLPLVTCGSRSASG